MMTDHSTIETTNKHSHHHNNAKDPSGGEGSGSYFLDDGIDDIESIDSPTSEETHEGSMSHEEEIAAIRDELTKRETAAVFRLRVSVILVLLAAATGVSVTVFLLTRTAERDELDIQYEGTATKILESFNDIFTEMGSVSGLAVSQTAHSVDHKLPFPFMTMSNFQEKAGNARSSSQVLYVSISYLVTHDQLNDWDDFVMGGNNTWIDEGFKFQEIADINDFEDPTIVANSWLTTNRKVDPPHIFTSDGVPQPQNIDTDLGPYLLRWQTSPILKRSLVNVNLFQQSETSENSHRCLETESAVLSGFVTAPSGGPSYHENSTTSFFATLQSIKEGKRVEYLGDPMAHFLIPVYDTFDILNRKAIAVMRSTIHWRSYFQSILPSNVKGIIVVLDNQCDGSYTYEINGDEAHVVGYGDHHDPTFDYMERTTRFTLNTLDDGTATGLKFNQEGCPYTLRVYPSHKYLKEIITSDPTIVTVAVGLVFFFTIILFLLYDRLVERRQRLILAKATQSTAIVSSLFPKQVRDRVLHGGNGMGGNGNGGDTNWNGNGSSSHLSLAPNHRLKTYLSGNTNDVHANNQPIADLFPNCTVLFADISGFTAWSSTREPAQVFVLLQAVYQAFDSIAKRRGVFKVETIGDSYLAVTGLPEPQVNHAILMARFAWECLLKMGTITKELEVTLGPDTGDLVMRFGLHSGPVTAGVLRGERARFQLFGDTVNTAARMESTGVRNMIQISQATADILTKAGKTHWIKPREDAVKAKGKGVLNTFWLNPSTRLEQSRQLSDVALPIQMSIETSLEVTAVDKAESDAKTERLVGWTAEILLEHIRKILAVRRIDSKFTSNKGDVSYHPPKGATLLDEVKESMSMPKFNPKTAAAVEKYNDVPIDSGIVKSLKEYVGIIATTYRNNQFHNFEHACHVTMSVNKLLKRIVAPELSAEQLEEVANGGRQGLASHLHDFSHGIVSDPMASFAITFSALIHDADHKGISNDQLISEEPELAKSYRNKSVAEQHSLNIAWDVLMLEQFDGLRRLIFGTKSELMRFRQLIVNVVLATDIFDKELNDLRKYRWEKAFSEEATKDDDNIVADLRATIVMEHIIQASDVSHTMQHWHVYRKWNKCLLREMYTAYRTGRMGTDPTTFWYQGELRFFDNYVIPLAKKLKECNVFGVSSDEYLNYAEMNRAEWEERGQEIVNDLIKEVSQEESPSSSTTTTSLAMVV